jgi:hypothetical protein
VSELGIEFFSSCRYLLNCNHQQDEVYKLYEAKNVARFCFPQLSGRYTSQVTDPQPRHGSAILSYHFGLTSSFVSDLSSKGFVLAPA